VCKESLVAPEVLLDCIHNDDHIREYGTTKKAYSVQLARQEVHMIRDDKHWFAKTNDNYSEEWDIATFSIFLGRRSREICATKCKSKMIFVVCSRWLVHTNLALYRRPHRDGVNDRWNTRVHRILSS
jgi:hypothetical protein